MKTKTFQKSLIMVISFAILSGLVFGDKAAALPGILKPERIYVHKNRLYVVERITISVFSLKDFDLIKKIGKEGEGPGEFKEQVFNLHFKDGQVLVNSAGRVTYFSEDGTYIKEEKSSAPGTGSFLPVKDKFVGLQVKGEEGKFFKIISLFDANFQKIKEIYRIEDDFRPGKEMRAFIEPQMFDVVDNKIIVTFDKNFVITVFDAAGNVDFTIKRKYDRIKVSDAHKEAVHFFYRTDPYYKQYYGRLKNILTFPGYLPAIRFFFLSGNKIYVQTYKRENNKSEFFIFDKTGNLIKKVFVPFIEEEFSYNEFSFPRHHAVAGGKLYQLLENDEEEWDLYITHIK